MKSDNPYAYLKGDDLYAVREAIAEIAKGGNQDMPQWVYETLLLRITQGKSDVVLNAVLDSELADNEKKLILDKIIDKELHSHKGSNSVFLDNITSRISEMYTRPGQEARDDQLSNFMSKVVTERESASFGSDTRLTKLIMLTKQEQIGDKPRNISAEAHDFYKQAGFDEEYMVAPVELVDSHTQARAVQNYVLLEKDPAKRQLFAAKQLNQYVESLDVTNLNAKEKEKISNAMTAIMEPICSHEEKISLKNSVDKLVRECAHHAGEKMSFSKAWHAMVDPIKRMLGRENVLKSFEQESVAIGQTIKSKTTSFAQKAADAKAAVQKKPEGQVR